MYKNQPTTSKYGLLCALFFMLSSGHSYTYANESQQDVTFSGFIINGLGAYSSAELLPLYESYLGRSVNIATLQEVAKTIQRYYHTRGYALAQVYLPKQVIRAGLVQLQIKEGLVDDIRVTGAITSTPGHIQRLIQDVDLSQPLTKATLQRILFYLNQLHGYTVKPQVVRDKKNTNSLILELVFNEKKDWNGYVQVDRRGIDSLGKVFGEAQLSFSRVFNEFDQLKFTYTSSSQSRELGNLNMNYQIALSPTTKLELNNSWMEARPGGNVSKLELFIKARHHSVGLEKYYFHNSNLKYIYGLTLLQDKIDAYSAGALLSRDNIYALRGNLGWKYTPQDTSHAYDFAVTQGIKTNDSESVSIANSFTPTDLEDFTLYNFDYQYQNPLTDTINLTMQLEGQYASASLPVAYKYAFGGETLGRGYDAAELIGDHGLSASASLQKQLQTSLFPATKTDVYVHYDFGSSWAIEPNSTLRQSAASVAAGMNLTSKQTNWNMEIAAPLTKPLANEADKDKVRLFVKFKYRFN